MYAIPTIAVSSLALLLGIIGFVQLAGPKFLRDLYRRWDYPPGTRIVTGLLDIMAGVLILEPSMRGWGIALAAFLIFGSAVTLLNHRHYAGAAAVIVMMAALIPATLAVPRANEVRFIGSETQLVAVAR